MSISIDDLAARLTALEAREAALEGRTTALEAQIHPSNVCIYAGQVYGEGSVIKQADDKFYMCKLKFPTTDKYDWELN
jgi:hypothetical protein